MYYQRYSKVFRPGRGNPLGTPMHIVLDLNVRPVHLQCIECPYQSWAELIKSQRDSVMRAS